MSKQNQRVSRREQMRQKNARDQRIRTLRIAIPVVVIAFILVGLWLSRVLAPDVDGIVTIDSPPGNEHDPDLQIAFGGIPPMGGPHNPTWQNCGIYTSPVEAQYAIHSMEHGAVWITYHPDLPADQVASLQDHARGKSYMIVSPYPDQDANIVLTTWDIQLVVEDATDDRIAEFISKYRGNRGPEGGASCSGGIGTPIQT